MILNITVQLALTFNNLANAPALQAFGSNEGSKGETWKLYLIYTCWVGFELAIVYWKYIETKGPMLEELAKITDGPDAAPVLDPAQTEKETQTATRATRRSASRSRAPPWAMTRGDGFDACDCRASFLISLRRKRKRPGP